MAANTLIWTCRACRLRSQNALRQSASVTSTTLRTLSTATEDSSRSLFEAAPEIDFDKVQENAITRQPARIVPASPSYFTTSPNFNDRFLMLQQYHQQFGTLPVLPPDQAPRTSWLTLKQFRANMGEDVGAAKHARAIQIVRRLNLIHPKIRPAHLQNLIADFQRPRSESTDQRKRPTIDEYGRARGVGGRKTSTARVQLVEGTGEVVVNGRGLAQAFPRLHDRESALWPLKATDRLDKYNVFALVNGGGVTGQAESVTLALARALMVHEPALKPALRKAGCVTRVPKKVERKKHGRVKARKRPQWVKR